MQIRNYQAADFESFVELVNHLEPHGQLQDSKDIQDSFIREKAEPEKNIFLISDGARFLGYARIDPNSDGTLNRHNFYMHMEDMLISDTSFIDGLIHRIEARINEIATEYNDPLQIRAWCYDDGPYAPIYERHGYTLGRYFARLDLLDPGKLNPLPDIEGIEIRLFNPATEAEKFLAAYNLGFEGHFEHHPVSWSEFFDIMKTGWFQPNLMYVAVKDGEFLGVCWNVLQRQPEADGFLWGVVSELGVIPDWRGKGLGRALIRRGMLGLRDAGAQRICLWVDYANPFGAKKLYYSEGFVDRYIEKCMAKNA